MNSQLYKLNSIWYNCLEYGHGAFIDKYSSMYVQYYFEIYLIMPTRHMQLLCKLYEICWFVSGVINKRLSHRIALFVIWEAAFLDSDFTFVYSMYAYIFLQLHMHTCVCVCGSVWLYMRR